MGYGEPWLEAEPLMWLNGSGRSYCGMLRRVWMDEDLRDNCHAIQARIDVWREAEREGWETHDRDLMIRDRSGRCGYVLELIKRPAPVGWDANGSPVEGE